MFLVLWWGDMTNVQVVKLFFIPRQRGITVATSPNRSASSSRMMIMKTNGSLAWRWNHMRIRVRRKHACVCIHTRRPKYTNLLGMRENKPLLCALVCVCVCVCVWKKGGGFQCDFSLYWHTLVCVIVCSWTTETKWICGTGVWGFMCHHMHFFVCCVLPPRLVALSAFNPLRPRPKQNSVSDNTFSAQARPAPQGHYFSCCAIIIGRFWSVANAHTWRSLSFICLHSSFLSSPRVWDWQRVWFSVLFQQIPPRFKHQICESQWAWLTLLLCKWGCEASSCSVVGSTHRQSTTLCHQIEMRCNSTQLPLFSIKVDALVSKLCQFGVFTFSLLMITLTPLNLLPLLSLIFHFFCISLTHTHTHTHKCKHTGARLAWPVLPPCPPSLALLTIAVRGVITDCCCL